MADSLDSLVKGAPLSGQPTSSSASDAFSNLNSSSGIGESASRKEDGVQASEQPAMVYLNMLILEASLRAQYLALRTRRRHHTFFLLLLGAWILGFGYALFFAPREDGSGVGGSVYWVVDVLEKVCFMGGVITAVLVWATGIWDRGVRWPRRWFSVSNRGLRHINCKLVLLKRPWWAECLATLGWFLTYGLLSNTGGVSSYRYIDPALLREVDRELNIKRSGWRQHPTVPLSAGMDEEKGSLRRNSLNIAHRAGSRDLRQEEDLAPGGDHVKLLLLAKPFSPSFRESWELYRQEYWDKENERRARVRQKLKEQDRALRRATGGWFWWLPGRRIPESAYLQHHLHHQRPNTLRNQGSGSGDGEKHGHTPQHLRHSAVEREHRRTRSNSSRRASTSTVASTGQNAGSRSATPTVDAEDPSETLGTRKASATLSAPDRRRKKSTASGQGGSLRGAGTGTAGRRPALASDSRSVTPEIPSPLAKEQIRSSSSPERQGRS
ncbi:Nem1-Spo7 phosphatase regulatory subunit [Sporothrix epigloea]|uniref:Nem1-Spo7 phosphatase regulatory subunit n=1 Tax=Sporothrix epigloea TaxID=1892477 RepID=A0ABP0DNV5_9PEZI